MSEPIKVNVVSYGGVKPGQVVFGNTRSGGKAVAFDAATAVSANTLVNLKKVTSWDVDMPNLETCTNLFLDFSELQSFRGRLPKLRECNGFMFENTRLQSFETELPSLENGHNLLYGCSGITEFNIALPVLKRAETMFYKTSITAFNVDVSTLERATGTFEGCTKLTSFGSALPALVSAPRMFSGCKLDLQSVQNIANTINSPVESGRITIGVDKTKVTQEQQDELDAVMASKNWTVTWERN